MKFVNEVLADDVWGGILYFMKAEEGESRFSTDLEPIHCALYKLRETGKFTGLLDKFTFGTRGFYPRSQILKNAIDHFQLSGLLEITSSDFKIFEIKDSIVSYFKEDLKSLFTEQQKEQLKRIAKAIVKYLKKTPEQALA